MTDEGPLPNPPDPFDDVVLDEDFVAGGVTERAGDERIAQARRIARNNDRLHAAGEISDGVGKPSYRRARRLVPWIAIGASIAVAIVVIVLVVR